MVWRNQIKQCGGPSASDLIILLFVTVFLFLLYIPYIHILPASISSSLYSTVISSYILTTCLTPSSTHYAT